MKYVRKSSLMLLVAGLAICALAAPEAANALTIEDGNSRVRITPDSDSGMDGWQVDGTDHLFKQWFYFRTALMVRERPVNDLPLAATVLSDTNGSGLNDTLYARYVMPRVMSVELKFTLDGNALGSNVSDLTEHIKITNLMDRLCLPISFFQYCDLDLGGFGNDTAALVGPGRVLQFDPVWVTSETVVLPPPAHWEIAYFPFTIDRLNDWAPTTLLDSVSPLGPGDVTWAFQWDYNIAPGQSVSIVKHKRIGLIPEPLTMLGVFMGVGGLAGYVRRRVA